MIARKQVKKCKTVMFLLLYISHFQELSIYDILGVRGFQMSFLDSVFFMLPHAFIFICPQVRRSYSEVSDMSSPDDPKHYAGSDLNQEPHSRLVIFFS